MALFMASWRRTSSRFSLKSFRCGQMSLVFFKSVLAFGLTTKISHFAAGIVCLFLKVETGIG
jgi:hypothetical protein